MILLLNTYNKYSSNICSSTTVIYTYMRYMREIISAIVYIVLLYDNLKFDNFCLNMVAYKP